MKLKYLLLCWLLESGFSTAAAQGGLGLKMLQSAYPGYTVAPLLIFNKVEPGFIAVTNDTNKLSLVFDTTGTQVSPGWVSTVSLHKPGFFEAFDADRKVGFFGDRGNWSTGFKYTETKVLESNGQTVLVGIWRKDYNPWGDPFFDCYDDKGVVVIRQCDGTVYKTGPNIIIATWPVSRSIQKRFRGYDFTGTVLFETEKYYELGIPNTNGEIWARETMYGGAPFDVINLQGKKIRKYKYPDGTLCPCEKFDPDFLQSSSKDGRPVILKADGKEYPNDVPGRILCPENNNYAIVDRTTLHEEHGKYFTTHDFGMIDLFGKTLVPAGQEAIGAYSEGYIAVRKDGYWGYMDSSGKEVIPFKYHGAGPFVNGAAMVSLSGSSFVIDKAGQSKKQCTSGDCMNGSGTLVENDVVYNGAFRNGQKDGYGHEITNGVEYTGTWYQGQKTGKGYISFRKDNLNADFEFMDGKPFHVRIEFRAGAVFEGSFTEDRNYYTGTLKKPTDGDGTVNHLSFNDLLKAVMLDNVLSFDSRRVRQVNERLHNSLLEEMAASWAEQEAYQYQRIQAESRRIKQQQEELEAYRQQRANEKEAEKVQRTNNNAGSTTCGCCGGSGSKVKLVPEFHKTGDRRIERPKPKPSGGGYIIEVYYEPMGYTTYRQENENCRCCNGSGKR